MGQSVLLHDPADKRWKVKATVVKRNPERTIRWPRQGATEKRAPEACQEPIGT